MPVADDTDISLWLSQQTGLDLALLQRPAVGSFVKRRWRELGLPDQRAYRERLASDAAELELLIQEISVPETWLFRYPESFRLLAQHLSALRSRQPRRALRMLSIACATGEEAYSMAIAAAHGGWPVEQIQVDAIDRHREWLALARRAAYRGGSLREQIPHWASPWLQRRPDSIAIDPSICKAVRFIHDDILTWSAIDGNPYDIVFCRNLLIYLHADARTILSARLASWLDADGLLFVGHAEQLESLSENFKPVPDPHTFALRPTAPQDHNAEPRTSRHENSKKRSLARRGAAEPIQGRKRAEPPSACSATASIPHKANAASVDDARALANDGALAEARCTIEAILAAQPPSADIYELLGSLNLGLGQIDDARDAFEKVLYFHPDHEAALLQLANLHEQTGEPRQAERFRRRAARAHAEQSSLSESDE